ncbi:MAG: hypothetical protein IV094_02070 [Vitreoscilla sp.]|nr:hypothetical protein [Vitreoscilla sp.]
MKKPGPRPQRDRPPKTLAQQKADFTAEGSPPPGQVATSMPATPGAASERPPKSTPTS